ncbi:efflux RND transporter periplasmic adaptor subunit [Tepidicaulis sp. LMO-SS28]|uniref:efflux RND transporter periplasmic adaptor subunit n=1 Tax=Tepidicaulis sp. LMO-SS28 TaxID=3447455 RepID=UPI003EE014A6
MIKWIVLCAAFSILPFVSEEAVAGAGHDHGEASFSGASTSPSFTLTDTVIQNLDIQTVAADMYEVQESARLLAQVKLLPERRAVITPRFPGKVIKIDVRLGDEIEKNAPLATLQPLNIGSAPVTLRSPISGVLSRQDVVTGAVVQPGGLMMEVSDRSYVLAKGVTYESELLGQVRNGQKAILTIDSLPGQHFLGEVQRIDPAIDEEQKTVSVFAVFENEGELLIPHMRGELEIFHGEGRMMLAVPAEAILGTLGQYFLFVRDGDYFERRDVTLGISRGGYREIISGVFPGEEVVVQGNYQLQYVTAPEGGTSLDAAEDHGHPH